MSYSMIRHVWSVLCANSSTDMDTNALSLFNTIEEINVPAEITLPVAFAVPFFLITLWTRSNLEQAVKGHSRLLLKMPSGETSELSTGVVDLTKYKRLRERTLIPAIQIVEPGLYNFVVQLQLNDSDFETVTEIPLEIEFAELTRDE